MKLLRTIVPLVMVAFAVEFLAFTAHGAFCRTMLKNERYLEQARATTARQKEAFRRRIDEFLESRPDDQELQKLAQAAANDELISLATIRGRQAILSFLDEISNVSPEPRRWSLPTKLVTGLGTYSLLYAMTDIDEFLEEPLFWAGNLGVAAAITAIHRMRSSQSSDTQEDNEIERIRLALNNDTFLPKDFYVYTRAIENAQSAGLALMKGNNGVYILDIVVW